MPMNPTTITLAAAGNSNMIIPDQYISPFNIGLGLVVTGAATSKVQHTFDDPFAASAPSNWIDHSTLTGKTVGAYDGNYAYPVRAIRIVQSSTGTTSLTVVQAGK